MLSERQRLAKFPEIVQHLTSPNHSSQIRNPVCGSEGRTWDLDEFLKYAEVHKNVNGVECYLSMESGTWVPISATPDENMRNVLADINQNIPIEDSKGLRCALTGQFMKDPVIASDGFTYEREAIERLFSSGNAISVAAGNKPFKDPTLRPHLTLRDLTAAVNEHILKAKADKGDSKAAAPIVSGGPTFVTDRARIKAMTDPHFPEAFVKDLERKPNLRGKVKTLRAVQEVGVIDLNLPADYKADQREKAYIEVMDDLAADYKLTTAKKEQIADKKDKKAVNARNTRGRAPSHSSDSDIDDDDENPKPKEQKADVVDAIVQRKPLKLHEIMMGVKDVPYSCSARTGKGAEYGVTEGVEEKFPYFTSFEQAKELLLRYADNWNAPTVELFTDEAKRQPFSVSPNLDQMPEKENVNRTWEPKEGSEDARRFAAISEFAWIQESESVQPFEKTGEKVKRYRILFNIEKLAAAFPDWLKAHPEVRAYAQYSTMPDFMLNFNIEKIKDKCMADMKANPVMCMDPINETKDYIDVRLSAFDPRVTYTTIHNVLALDLSGSMFVVVPQAAKDVGVDIEQLPEDLKRICQWGDVKTPEELKQLKDDPRTAKLFDEKFEGQLPTRAYFEIKAFKDFLKLHANNPKMRFSVLLWHKDVYAKTIRVTAAEALSFFEKTQITAGGTNYIKPLDLARQLFTDSQAEKEAKRLIFASDGVPSDLKTADAALEYVTKTFEGINVRIDTLLLFANDLPDKDRKKAEQILGRMATSGKIPGNPQSVIDPLRGVTNAMTQLGAANMGTGSACFVFASDKSNLYRIETTPGNWCEGVLRLQKSDLKADGNQYKLTLSNGTTIPLDTTNITFDVMPIPDGDIGKVITELMQMGVHVFDEPSIKKNIDGITKLRASYEQNGELGLVEFLDNVAKGTYAELDKLRREMVKAEIDIFSETSIEKNRVLLQSWLMDADKENKPEKAEFLQNILDHEYLREREELLTHPDVVNVMKQLAKLEVDIQRWKTIQDKAGKIEELTNAAIESKQPQAATFLRYVREGAFLPVPLPPADMITNTFKIEGGIERSKYVRRRHPRPHGPKEAPVVAKPKPDEPKKDPITDENIADKAKQYDVFGWEEGYRELQSKGLLGVATVAARDAKVEVRTTPAPSTGSLTISVAPASTLFPSPPKSTPAQPVQSATVAADRGDSKRADTGNTLFNPVDKPPETPKDESSKKASMHRYGRRIRKN